MRRGSAVQSSVVSLLAVTLGLVFFGRGSAWAQCPSLAAYEDFGQYNKSPNNVVVVGNYAFTADLHGLTIYDLSDPGDPAKVGELLLPDEAHGIAVSGSAAYVADGPSGLQIIDVSDPSNPVLLGSFDTPGNAFGLATSGSLVYVADRRSGLQVIDLSDPSNPVLLGNYDTPGDALGIAVSGSAAYVADGGSGLQVIDVSDPSNPAPLGSYKTPGNAMAITVSGSTAYVADFGSGLQVIDLSDPSNLTPLGHLDTPGYARDIAVSGSVAYVADDGSLQIIDVSDPPNPAPLGSYKTPGRAWGVAVSGSIACVADGNTGIQIIDVSDSSAPALLGSFETPGNALAVAVSGSLAYVADDLAGLQIIDVSDPSEPAWLGRCDTPGSASGVAVHGSVAYVADGGSGLQIIDVSDPSKPVILGSHETSGSALAVAVSGNLAYVADGWEGLQVIDVSDPSSPVQLSRYETQAVCEAVAASGSVAYVVETGSLQLIDMSDPSNPALLGSYETSRPAFDLTVSGGVAYLADGWAGLQVIDVSDPSNPALLGGHDTPGYSVGIAVSGSMAYVADSGSGLQIFDVSDRPNPELIASVGTYRPSYDAAVDPVTGVVWLADGALLESVETACLSCSGLLVKADPGTILAGGQTSAITVTVTDANGDPEPGRTVTGATDRGTISAFTDNGDGSYTATFTSDASVGWVDIHVWLDGRPCEAAGLVHVVFPPDPPLGGPLPEWQYMIPGSAHVSGANQTAWRSDAVLHNPGALDASVALFLLETGKDNSTAKGKVVAVPKGAAYALDDIVMQTFGASTSGAILVASDQPLMVTSRTYNDVAAGTYGQFIPGIGLDDAIGPNESVRLIQLGKNEHVRTNIGFANASSDPLHVTVELHRADGSLLASPELTVPPWGFFQKTRIITNTVDDAYAIVSSDSPGARYFTYASVVDNDSGDPIFIQPVKAAAGEIVVPATAHVRGAAGTNWKSDLEVHNPGTTAVSFTVEALLRDQANPSPDSASFEVEAGHSVRFVDVLSSVFGLSGAAALRVTPAAGTLMVTSRTYNDVSSGTFGQFIPGQPAAASAEMARGARLTQLSQSAKSDEGYRTNLGLTNVGDQQITVRIDLYDDAGEGLGSIDETLDAFEYVQIDRIFRKVTSNAVANGYAEVSSPTEHASFFAYASVVDNRSGDPVNVPATR